MNPVFLLLFSLPMASLGLNHILPKAAHRHLQGTLPAWGSWGFNTGWSNNDMTLGKGQTMTQGLGASGVSVNTAGLSANASGDKGSATRGSWNNANNSMSNNNAFGAFATPGAALGAATGGATAGAPLTGAFSTGWSNVSQTMGDTESMAMGKGASAISIGRGGASANSSGELGTSNSVNWGNNVNAWSNNFAY